MPPRRRDDVDHVAPQLGSHVHAQDGPLHGEHVRGLQHRLQQRVRVTRGLGLEDRLLRVRRRVPEAHSQHEAVELRLGQWIGALVLDRVLGGDDHEGRRHAVGDVVHGGLTLLHALQKAGLGLGGGPVDLVGEHDVGEHRPCAELEPGAVLVEHTDARHVAGQQVGSELDAREAAPDGARERLGQERLADAGVVLHDHVPAGEQRDHARLDDVLLAEDDGGDVARHEAGATADLGGLGVAERRRRGMGGAFTAARLTGVARRLGSVAVRPDEAWVEVVDGAGTLRGGAGLGSRSHGSFPGRVLWSLPI